MYKWQPCIPSLAVSPFPHPIQPLFSFSFSHLLSQFESTFQERERERSCEERREGEWLTTNREEVDSSSQSLSQCNRLYKTRIVTDVVEAKTDRYFLPLCVGPTLSADNALHFFWQNSLSTILPFRNLFLMQLLSRFFVLINRAMRNWPSSLATSALGQNDMLPGRPMPAGERAGGYE